MASGGEGLGVGIDGRLQRQVVTSASAGRGVFATRAGLRGLASAGGIKWARPSPPQPNADLM
jgi:hypothetical protein